MAKKVGLDQKYIMDSYGLPFLCKGLEIRCGADKGVITGFRNGYVQARLTDGEIASYHPTWDIAYLQNNQILKDFRTTGGKQNG